MEQTKNLQDEMLCFKVAIFYDSANELSMKNTLKGSFRFSLWRDDKNASSCEIQEILDKEKTLSPNQEKEAIIKVTKSPLSESFRINERLFWGGTQARVGNLVIKEIIFLEEDTLTLYRPVNQKELDLIVKSNWRKFPPRLPEQPIFYPVLNEEYANQIANDWNVPAYGIGYVTRFKVKKDFLKQYQVQNVGGKNHNELWIPAEDLEEFNNNIVDKIEVINEFK